MARNPTIGIIGGRSPESEPSITACMAFCFWVSRDLSILGSHLQLSSLLQALIDTGRGAAAQLGSSGLS